MNTTRKPFTVEAMSIEDALRNAKRLGYTSASTAIGTMRPINEFLEEMALDTESESPANYALFQNTIVNLAEAWSANAEVISLD